MSFPAKGWSLLQTSSGSRSLDPSSAPGRPHCPSVATPPPTKAGPYPSRRLEHRDTPHALSQGSLANQGVQNEVLGWPPRPGPILWNRNRTPGLVAKLDVSHHHGGFSPFSRRSQSGHGSRGRGCGLSNTDFPQPRPACSLQVWGAQPRSSAEPPEDHHVRGDRPATPAGYSGCFRHEAVDLSSRHGHFL